MADTRTKIGHSLAWILGIKLDDQNSEQVTRGESVFSISSVDTYVEAEPTVGEWIQEHTPSGRQIVQYFLNLFPFLRWITHYNFQWLIGDLVAGIRFHLSLTQCCWLLTTTGITIGAVVVPQGMAYAKLAELPVQFGLYSSFMGVLIYWFFATAKDITIGVSYLWNQFTTQPLTIGTARRCPFNSHRKYCS